MHHKCPEAKAAGDQHLWGSAAAAGTVFSGAITAGGNFRLTLLGVGGLFVVAGVVACFMPTRPAEEPAPPQP